MERMAANVASAIKQLLNTRMKKVEWDMSPEYTITVYWAGSVLRVDIKGLDSYQ